MLGNAAKYCKNRLDYKLSNIYIPPWGVVILHIGVGMPNTNVQDHSPGRDVANYYTTYSRQHHCRREICATSLDVA